MKTLAKRFAADESGATAIVTIFTAFKGKLSTAFDTMGTALQTQAANIK
ncbi:Flp family type IVb pilin [Methylobacterium sp. Leaf456]|nr:Flp family type IVb pilin [Methylobacterium sp. Leaf456]